MKYIAFIFAFLGASLLIGQSAQAWVQNIQEAHRTADFKDKYAIQFDLTLFFGGKKRLEATITGTTSSSKVKVARKDGAALLFDEGSVWKLPANAEWPSARFDALTWQYFFFAPHKFDDDGTNWKRTGKSKQNGLSYKTGKLTFETGTGDAPDDWYIAYTDAKTDQLATLAYIVTFGGRDATEAEPHAISYSDYQPVDGVPIAHQWTFNMWSPESGLGEEIGSATISNVRFLDASAADFKLDTAKATKVPLKK